MIYIVSYKSTNGNQGYSYHFSKKKAKKAISDYIKGDSIDETREFREGQIVNEFKTPKTQKEWLKLLNLAGSHNDNG